ncbi:peptidoglycan domain protein [Campylobacter sp. RM9344]|uniref:Peptidoglycan domain protein n=1 Tax=Campylobacter californiensis TaxID=1032243 RepID=A0AAW3ZWC9_9BACT|nr:glycosyl hydrolase 108 family protein [Campylobacter sp. RM9337]MBE3030098.1 peptidoglycan domain protein [Campylobacter sp. RM9344]MBE3608783.1 peptidoglycan domain protein [Campylobacter sp. RM9337]
MANFKQAYEVLLGLEFSDPGNALHQNPTEKGLTYMGIYEKAHPNWAGWGMVHTMIDVKKGDLKSASKVLMQNDFLQDLVVKFYRVNFWDKIKGDDINSQKKADEIFAFGVNVGIRTAIKTAQRVVGVVDDGNMSEASISAINRYDEVKFDKEYDKSEITYYNRLIEKKQNLKIYANGWRTRAEAV